MPRKKEEVLVHLDFDSLAKDLPTTEQVMKSKLIHESGASADEETLGSILKKKRQSKKLSLAEVSSKLRIKESFLKALEEGDYYVFSCVSYAQAFLKTYIHFLGLEPFALLEKFHQEVSHIKKETLELPKAQPELSKPPRRLWIVSLIVIFVLYLLWYVISAWRVDDSASKKTSEEDLATEKTEEQSSNPLPKEEIAKKMASIVKEASVVNPSVDEDTVFKGDLTQDSLPKNTLSLKAQEDVWMEVKNGNEVLFSEILSAGEVYTPPYSDSLTLTTTNAGAIQPILDEHLLPPLGSTGAFISRVPLNAESLKEKH